MGRDGKPEKLSGRRWKRESIPNYFWICILKVSICLLNIEDSYTKCMYCLIIWITATKSQDRSHTGWGPNIHLISALSVQHGPWPAPSWKPKALQSVNENQQSIWCYLVKSILFSMCTVYIQSTPWQCQWLSPVIHWSCIYKYISAWVYSLYMQS